MRAARGPVRSDRELPGWSGCWSTGTPTCTRWRTRRAVTGGGSRDELGAGADGRTRAVRPASAPATSRQRHAGAGCTAQPMATNVPPASPRRATVNTGPDAPTAVPPLPTHRLDADQLHHLRPVHPTQTNVPDRRGRRLHQLLRPRMASPGRETDDAERDGPLGGLRTVRRHRKVGLDNSRDGKAPLRGL
jgi:2-polyprenyl-6-methoxyphenol hydroxylase-like FAD-dependent oxidoreductase